jgi:hypothetical protein
VLPQEQAFEAIRRSVPRTVDAIRLFELVEEGLGERGVRDYWANARERCLWVRDAEREGWFLPRRLVYLELDRRDPPVVPMPEVELPDWLKPPELPEPPPPVEPQVVPLAVPGRPARLMIHEGAANADLSYDQRGLVSESMWTVGDLYWFGKGMTEPFYVDPLAKPPPAPPIGLLTREDLRPEGHRVEELAEMVLALDYDRADAGRVWVPAVTPGGVIGAWGRGLQNLRKAAWEGRVPEQAGWIVIDAFNGTAMAVGDTFDEAVAAWREGGRRLRRARRRTCVRASRP